MEEQTYRVERCDGKVQWDEFVLENGGHPLQLWGWGALKSTYKWQVERLFFIENDEVIGGAQLLIRKVPGPFKHWLYVPRGPIAITPDKIEIIYQQLARYVNLQHTGVALRIEPNSATAPESTDWQQTSQPLLPKNTVILDLTRSEGSLLAEISSEVRTQVRTGGEQDLRIERCTTRPALTAVIDLYKDQAGKRGDKLHKDAYYKRLFEQMGEYTVVFGAYSGETLVGFSWLLISESIAFELFFEATTPEAAAAVLRWSSIRRAKQWGIPAYDLNVAPTEAALAYGNHPYEFAGSYDLPLSWLYKTWRRALGSRLS